ncbi:MAG: carcinine hydrolase/isopenicillin-N N-acyltransferase family protein [Prevotella sp.]|jgi:hypothetical protein|nr:carcinine hydrolase/isopenicillin-N N-acyltransferase family protein [Prevotella sp.]
MRRLCIILSLFFVFLLPTVACTTAIISGKYTVNGRPLLYKHRDTGSLQNKLMAFSDGKYRYIGIVNSSDNIGREVWGGYNETGFAIMNSASYNLNPEEKGKPELEGEVMKLALQQCVTVDDFQRLLDSLPKPMYLSANFGVIDAQGNGAYFETGDYKYVKFDVNDTITAPHGYLLRTNFSHKGDDSKRRGVARYIEAAGMFNLAASVDSLSARFLFNDVSRNLTHGITNVDLYNSTPEDPGLLAFVSFRDFIPRYSTASVIVIEGVKQRESPDFTTMWTTMGSPLSTVAIPVWLNKDNYYPSVLLADETGNAPLCNWSLKIKKQLFPLAGEEGKDYLRLASLINKQGTGIMQETARIEQEILLKSNEQLTLMREGRITPDKIKDFCDWVDQYVTEEYFKTFNTLKE